VVENFFSTTPSIQQQKIPNYRTLFITTASVAILYAVADLSVDAIPGIMDYCFWYDLTVTVRDSVEKRLCTLIFEGRLMTAIALYVTYKFVLSEYELMG
jgi:hypothetical protein